MEYLIHLAILVSIYSILAISLNLIIGYTGMLSVAHAAFYGIGAYSVGLLTKNLGVNFFHAMLIGVFITAIISLLIGYALSRLKGDYFALASFGFNIIIFSILLNWQSVTNGPLGVFGIGRPSIFGISLNENMYFLVLAALVAVIVYYFSEFLTKSSFGRILKSIREDEEMISVFGYKTINYKLTIFVIGSVIASIAGALYASYISFIDPSSFSLNESLFILAIIILGGLASNKGAVLGAAFMILLPELLRFVGLPSDVAAQLRQIIYGLILIVLMMYKPQGLLGKYRM